MSKGKLENRDIPRLVKLVDKGLALELVGDIVGISREWVRKVYKRETGRHAPKFKSMAKKSWESDPSLIKHNIPHYCNVCGTKSWQFEKNKNSLRHVCSIRCANIYNQHLRSLNHMKRCDICRDLYFPARVTVEKSRVCSQECNDILLGLGGITKYLKKKYNKQ